MEWRLLNELCNPQYNVGLVANFQASKYPTGNINKIFCIFGIIITNNSIKSSL